MRVANVARSKMKVSASRKVFVAFNTVIVLALTLVFIAPYLHILAKSLNDAGDTALGGITFLPRKWTFDNMKVILIDKTTWYGFIVTVARVVIGSVIALIVTYFAAYALLRKGLRFRGIIVAYLTVPMFFGGGLIANWVWFERLGLLNNFLLYVLPCAFSFYNMAVVRTYLQTIPESLAESARLDGANELKILWSIMMPLSKPIIAVILLWNAVFYWNDWTTTLYYFTDPYLYTLQYNLQQILKEAERFQSLMQNAQQSGSIFNSDLSDSLTPEAIQSAQIIVSTLPIVLVYPFVQKYFVSGVMIGSVKE